MAFFQEEKDLDQPEIFQQLYKYQYFNLKKAQYRTNSHFNIVNAKLDIIGITEEQNTKLKEIYSAYIDDSIETIKMNICENNFLLKLIPIILAIKKNKYMKQHSKKYFINFIIYNSK